MTSSPGPARVDLYGASTRSISIVKKKHFFEVDNGGGCSLRGHGMKLKVQRSRLQLRHSFFSHMIIKLWNMLPASVVEASTVRTFQKRLDDWITDVEL